MNTEAMKLALEALEPVSTFGRVGSRDVDTAKAQEAITALQEELAQQEQEPVAIVDDSGVIVVCSYHYKPGDKLYTSPPARKPLTKSQVLDLWEQTYVQRGTTGIEFARAIEAAHGIKE